MPILDSNVAVDVFPRVAVAVNMSALKAWRRVVRYLQQDLREILVPTSLPDPPGYTPARKLGWKERVEVCKGQSTIFAASELIEGSAQFC